MPRQGLRWVPARDEPKLVVRRAGPALQSPDWYDCLLASEKHARRAPIHISAWPSGRATKAHVRRVAVDIAGTWCTPESRIGIDAAIALGVLANTCPKTCARGWVAGAENHLHVGLSAWINRDFAKRTDLRTGIHDRPTTDLELRGGCQAQWCESMQPQTLPGSSRVISTFWAGLTRLWL